VALERWLPRPALLFVVWDLDLGRVLAIPDQGCPRGYGADTGFMPGTCFSLTTHSLHGPGSWVCMTRAHLYRVSAFFCVCVVLGFELRAYTLSLSTSPFL
jgi:hypothetical protein